jgi:hypothetical protein
LISQSRGLGDVYKRQPYTSLLKKQMVPCAMLYPYLIA